jgi:replicative DNA helicase
MANKDQITQILSRCKAHYGAELVLYKFPADEVSVSTLHQVMDFLRRNKGFNPKVVIVDYLELMISRNKFMNRDDYARQKSIATELCSFADKEGVAVFTATQTNRYGMTEEEQANKKMVGTGGGKAIDLDKIAESFGKSMPLAYVVSINQTKNEYEAGYDKGRIENTAARARLFIAKNRNGPKSETVTIRMNYITMKAKEDEPAANITAAGGNQ